MLGQKQQVTPLFFKKIIKKQVKSELAAQSEQFYSLRWSMCVLSVLFFKILWSFISQDFSCPGKAYKTISSHSLFIFSVFIHQSQLWPQVDSYVFIQGVICNIWKIVQVIETIQVLPLFGLPQQCIPISREEKVESLMLFKSWKLTNIHYKQGIWSWISMLSFRFTWDWLFSPSLQPYLREMGTSKQQIKHFWSEFLSDPLQQKQAM